MPQDQRYEYRIVDVGNSGGFEALVDEINDLAEEGWKVAETIESGGHTVEYLLERPVE